MLGATDPALLAAYDDFYEKLTLVPRHLSEQQRELIWAALLAAAGEEQGHIHMRRAIAVGLSHDQIADAIALAAAAEAAPSLAFAHRHWGEWVNEERTTSRYLGMIEAARGAIAPALAEVILVVSQAARRRTDAMPLHLERGFEAGATVPEVAEALSYLLIPCGANILIDAVQTWHDTAEAGRCPPPYP